MRTPTDRRRDQGDCFSVCAWAALAVGVVVMLAESLPAQTLPSGATITVPLEICRGLPLVHAHVNGRGPFLCLVDSGTTPCIVDSAVARDLGLILTGRRRTREAGGSSMEFATTFIERVDLDGIRLENLAAAVSDLSGPGSAIGKPLACILGSHLFRDHLVTIDYPSSAMTFEKGFLPRPNGRDILELDVQSRRSLTPVVAVEMAGESYRLVVDTGSNAGFKLPPALRESLPLKEGVSPAAGMQTAATIMTVQAAQLDGDVRLAGQVIPSPSVEFGPGTASMGGEILRHFRVTFDYAGGRVRLRRATTGLIEIRRSGVGLGLLKRGEHWEVVQVEPGSWADRMNVRPGDLLLAVDGASPDRASCLGWREQIGSRKAIELAFSRSGEEYRRLLPADVVKGRGATSEPPAATRPG
jgi:hypothetical protein